MLLHFLFVLSLTVLAHAKTKGTSTTGGDGLPDLYASVGPCNAKMLDRRMKTFDIDQIANTGNNSYLFSTDLVNVSCSSGDIHGDPLMLYKATAYNFDTVGGSTKISFTVRPLGEGIFDETYLYTSPITKSSILFRFKLIVLNYNDELGLFYYGRCSDYGKKTTDSRSIVVSSCNINNEDVQELAEFWAEEDAQADYLGPPLQEVPQCSCFFNYR
uniref:Lipocalin/cytosolic fatty-acid binding domain-containing protein n=1 Tax=Clastoptera arizonana TaxID=38151 RepID=A0A1B6D3D2_9HEMI